MLVALSEWQGPIMPFEDVLVGILARKAGLQMIRETRLVQFKEQGRAHIMRRGLISVHPVRLGGGDMLARILESHSTDFNHAEVTPKLSRFIYYVHARGIDGHLHEAVICVPPKVGSTSFFYWLYEQLSGHNWPYDKYSSPWVMEVSSPRWRNLSGGTVTPLIHLDTKNQRRILGSNSVHRFAFVRHPLHRALSAHKSKVECGTEDTEDRLRAHAKLIRHAPIASEAVGLSPGAHANCKIPIGVGTWARMLIEMRTQNIATDPHFAQQCEICGYGGGRGVTYDTWLPMENFTAGAEVLRTHLGLRDIKVAHEHISKCFTTATGERLPCLNRSSELRQLPPDDVNLLYVAFESDVISLTPFYEDLQSLQSRF